MWIHVILLILHVSSLIECREITLNNKMSEALLIESIKKEDVFENREIKAEYIEYEDIVVHDFISKLSSLLDDIGSVTNILDDIEDVPQSSFS